MHGLSCFHERSVVLSETCEEKGHVPVGYWRIWFYAYDLLSGLKSLLIAPQALVVQCQACLCLNTVGLQFDSPFPCFNCRFVKTRLTEWKRGDTGIDLSNSRRNRIILRFVVDYHPCSDVWCCACISAHTSAAASVPNPYLGGGSPALMEKTDPASLYAGFGSPVVPNRIPLELS